MAKSTRKEGYQKRLGALKSERATWESHWKDLNDYIQPRLGRFTTTDQNKGSRKDTQIVNSTPTIAARTLGSGLLAGTSSPSRPWFRLTTPDPTVAESGKVKIWLHYVEERMRKAMAASNIYLALGQTDEELGVFGTSLMLVEEDREKIFRCTVVPMGQYYLACGPTGEVDTVYREFNMTVAQTVQRFGIDAVSSGTKNAWDNEEFDNPVSILHVIEPRAIRDTDSGLARDKPWASIWYEVSENDDKVLAESGYDERPFCAARWYVTSGDVYGRSPGMDMLGDAKQLQQLERRKLQLIDKGTNPPMRAPVRAKETRCSLLPGDITYVDSTSGGTQYEPAYIIPPALVAEVRQEIATVEARINEAMYSSLFLMLATSDRRDVTAREVEERHEEKTLQLGPVLERMHSELFSPLIERIFGILLRAGQIPPAPEELQGAELKIEYVSVLASAQKLTAVVGLERLFGFLGNLSGALPTVLDIADSDKAIREYATAIGVAPDILRGEEELAEIRKAREQAQAQVQAQQAVQTTQGLAQSAKTLSEADTAGDNAFSRLVAASGAQGAIPQAQELPA